MTAPPKDLSGAYMVFLLAGKRYGVDAASLKESVLLPELTPLDDEPNYIAGAMNLRGRVVQVMDLNLRMGRRTAPYTPHHLVVVLLHRDGCLGLMAEDITELREYGPDDVEELRHFETPEFEMPKRLEHCVSGTAKDPEGLVMLLDIPTLFKAAWPEDPKMEAPEPGTLLAPGLFCPHADDEARRIFRKRKAYLMAPVMHDEDTDAEALALIRIGGEYLAAGLSLIRGFANVNRVAPVPCCPGHIVGNVNLRGEIITVVDLRGLLQLPVTELPGRFQVMVAEADGVPTAVPVDEVLDIIYLNPDDISPAPVAGTGMSGEYLKGAVIYNGGMVNVLDLNHILLSETLLINHTRETLA